VYQCEATSVAGFIQQLAVSYLGNGYYFYVAGEIPAHKDPTRTDCKIIEQYGVDISKWARARRKKAGQANVHYIRFCHFYVVIATHGSHPFFESEARRIKDVRETPIRFAGYSIALRRAWNGGGWHPSVRIDRDRYRELKAYFESMAVHRSVQNLCQEISSLPFESYAPVRNQFYMLLRAANRCRKAAGFELIPTVGLWRRRRSVKPFG